MMKKSLAFLFVALLIVPVVPLGRAQEQEWRAVVVGIESYEEINACSWADDDARVLGETLSPEWNEVRVLIDEDATRAGVSGAVEWLASEAGDEDVSMFYFAGHGTNDGQDTYICCYDATFEGGSGKIGDHELAEMLGSVKGQKIVILDSCYSGGFIYKESMSVRSLPEFVPRVMAGTPDVELDSGIAEKLSDLAIDNYEVMTACAVDETALGSRALKHGVFTYFLLEGMSNADLVADGSVTTRELFDYAEPRTVEFTQNKNHDEHPQWWDGVYGTDLRMVMLL